MLKNNFSLSFVFVVFSAFTFSRVAEAYSVEAFPILERLQLENKPLAKNTLDWMKKWKDVDLEDSTQYRFLELSGSTSVNMKIQKLAPESAKGYKSLGAFVPRNSSANPNTEVAYFNLAAIFGYDRLFRPAVPYLLGPTASGSFQQLMLNAKLTSKARIDNRTRHLAGIATGQTLKGCLKAGNPDTAVSLDEMVSPRTPPNGAPKPTHPVIQFLQVENPKPLNTQTLTLKPGYSGNALELTRQYSIIMTMDAIFGQWDRYSGGNLVIDLDENGEAFFYSTDNGGADFAKTTGWVVRNLSWFSRFDRELIEKIKALQLFLENPSSGFLGYTSAEEFVVDLGLYFELKPSMYAIRLKRNIDLVLKRVQDLESQHGDEIYLN